MNNIPVIIGGVAKEAKPSIIIGGVKKQVCRGRIIVDGVAKEFYKSAVEYTSVASIDATDGGNILYDKQALTAFLGYRKNSSNMRKAQIVWTFSDAILLGAGVAARFTANQSSENPFDYIAGIVLLDSNGNQVGANYGCGYQDLTLTSDVSVKSIRATFQETTYKDPVAIGISVFVRIIPKNSTETVLNYSGSIEL